jgi:hypothetical protein
VRQSILVLALLVALGPSCGPQVRPQFPPPRPTTETAAAEPVAEPSAGAVADPAASRSTRPEGTPQLAPPVAPPVAREPAAPPEDPQAAELYEQARQAVELGRHDEALHLWEELWESAPGFRDVGRLLANEYLVRGLERYARADLDEAIDLWEHALAIDPRNRRARGYLDNVRSKRDRLQEVMTESAPAPEARSGDESEDAPGSVSD